MSSQKDGCVLWGALTTPGALPSEPASLAVLTGVPAGKLGGQATKQKRAWCARELGKAVRRTRTISR